MRALQYLVAASLLMMCLTARSPAEDIVILTGGTSGVYYPLGLALQKIFERDLPNSKVSVISTQATVENLNLLQQGKGQLALAQGDILTDAWKGNPEAGFPSSRTKIRLVGAAFPNYIHIIARRDANIASVQDLRGKRVSVGAARSGNELNARALLSAADMSYADLLQVEYLAYGESVDLMAKQQLDVAIISAGLGVAAVNNAVSQMPIAFVPVRRDLIDKTRDMFFAADIPANTYKTQSSDIPTAALNNFSVTTSDASEDTVYRITKSIFSNVQELQAAHPAARVLNREKALVVRPIDIHPGAARYFREVNLLR
jgi:TRAP transporter TAXI family solute receptor